MIKEILEQPYVAKRLIDSFETSQKKNFQDFVEMMKGKKVDFLACGTSYHASLVGVSILKSVGISSRSVVASEWENFIDADENTFVIAISQSGETMDVVRPLKNAKKKGATIGSIVNVPYSTIQRLSDISINILAGPEIAVASTKAFTNMNITILQIARLLGYDIDIESIPEKLKQTLKLREKCKEVAKELYNKHDIYVLGKHFSYPIAREIALKFKEVDYIHAEGMMAGELKHGTLALIEEDVPVMSLIYDNNAEMLSSTQEVRARGAKIYLIGNKGEMDFKVPDCNIADFAVYTTMIGHLISYEIGMLKGVEIDQCRNLAKSVTVL
jgi:glucosamine--fructose-6-phosphate aminotransferase (isomerizing)